MSQVNHNYSYVFEIDGYTVWERLRNLRNFKSDREKALALAELSLEQFAVKEKRALKKIERLKETLALYLADGAVCSEEDIEDVTIAVEDAEFEYRKNCIEFQGHDELTQDCRDELEFINLFESRLAEEAEKTRVPGKTDREMYEINFPFEARTRNFSRAALEAMTTGRASPESLNNARRDPVFAQMLIEANLLTEEVIANLISSVPDEVTKVHNLIAPLPASMILTLAKPEE